MDGNGNRLTTPPYLVTFHAVIDRGVTQPLVNEQVTSVNGVAEIRVTTGQVVDTQQFAVSVASPADPTMTLLTDPVFVTVTTRGLPQRLVIGYGDNNPNGIGRAEVPFVIAVSVLDANGGEVSYEQSRSVKLSAVNRDTGKVAPPQTVSAVNGKATFSAAWTDAGHYAVKVEAAGLLSAITQGYGGSQPDIVIEPGHHTQVRLSVDTAVLQAGGAGQSYAWVTAELLDAYNNVTTNQTGAPITIDLTVLNWDLTNGYFTIDDDQASYKTNVRTVAIPNGNSSSARIKLFPGDAGRITLRADTRDGVQSKLVAVDVAMLNPLAMLDAPKRLTAGPGVTTQWLVITAQDASRRRLTGRQGTIHVAALSPGAVILGYDVAGTLVPVTNNEVPMDRGQIRLLVTATAGSLSVFEAYDVQTPTVKAPLIYVQF